MVSRVSPVEIIFSIYNVKINVVDSVLFLLILATATGSVQCKELNKEDYTKIVWTSIAEIPGINLACEVIHMRSA